MVSEVATLGAPADPVRSAGVAHVVYSSVGGAERNTGIPHFESEHRVEEHLRAIGLRATILRPVFFMENFVGPAGPRETAGELVVRLALPPERMLQLIAVRDIGRWRARSPSLLDAPCASSSSRSTSSPPETPRTRSCSAGSQRAVRRVARRRRWWAAGAELISAPTTAVRSTTYAPARSPPS